MFARLLPIAIAASLTFSMGCGDKPTHPNIDKWMNTEKGPGKLKKALLDDSIDADLSAHAAANMIKKGRDPEVREAFDQMITGRRTEVIAKLAPRLWEIARIEGELSLPAPPNVAAKDGLFQIRKYADDATKAQIDKYLIDWYCVTSYEGRAHSGSAQGATVIRTLGPAAGKKLIEVVNAVIAAPGQTKTKNRIGDELLLGMAASGNPDAVKYILDIAKMDRGDPTLAPRAMSALFRGYVNSEGLFEPADPAALAPHLAQIVALVKDESLPGEVADDGVKLIRAVGAPACVAPLVGMIPTPHSNLRFKYVAAQQALACGGTTAIAEVVRALPDVPYRQDELSGAIAQTVGGMSPRPAVLAAVRPLLDDRKPIVRWVAIETLAVMKSVEDAPKIAALSSSGDRLAGYWGPGSDKPDPTLGQRAKELSAQLGKGSK
ncbi:MAG: hypothetical protein JWO36_6761 [Myxococcales bacterium]|nr:hypothetical protein [Myxococcales bacterium]